MERALGPELFDFYRIFLSADIDTRDRFDLRLSPDLGQSASGDDRFRLEVSGRDLLERVLVELGVSARSRSVGELPGGRPISDTEPIDISELVAHAEGRRFSVTLIALETTLDVMQERLTRVLGLDGVRLIRQAA